jgi:hypothetical protein
VQYAKISGGTGAAIDITDEKLQLAKDLGADLVIDARAEDPAKVLQAHGGASVAVGLAVDDKSFATAYAGLRRGGPTPGRLTAPGGPDTPNTAPPNSVCGSYAVTPRSRRCVALADGLATLAMIRQATGDPAGALEAITEAGQASPGPAGLLNPPPPGGPGCCWPKVTWPRRPVSRRRTASAPTMSRTTRASPGTWRWPGCCSPRTGPGRRWHC